jgi:hypothetical protein
MKMIFITSSFHKTKLNDQEHGENQAADQANCLVVVIPYYSSGWPLFSSIGPGRENSDNRPRNDNSSARRSQLSPPTTCNREDANSSSAEVGYQMVDGSFRPMSIFSDINVRVLNPRTWIFISKRDPGG